MDKNYNINVGVDTIYVREYSEPHNNRFVFAYTVTIHNKGTVAAKLLNRHWIITDENGAVQEVKGQGVVGENPHLKPGQKFQYTSSTIINTPTGSMQGSYQMIADDGKEFEVLIPIFTLSVPHTLH